LMMYRERFITDIHHTILWLVTMNLIHEEKLMIYMVE